MSRRGENIYKRKDGRWEGRYALIINGKRVYKSVYDKNYRAVKEKLELVKTNMVNSYLQSEMVHNHRHNYLDVSLYEIAKKERYKSLYYQSDADEYLWENIVSKWLEHIHETRKYSTYIKYLSIYEKHLKKFSNINIHEINLYVKEWRLHENNCSESLMHEIYRVINQIIKYTNITMDLSIPAITYPDKSSRQKKIIIFNHSEQRTFLNYLSLDSDVYKSGILLCFYTGLRLGEICSLKWEDIDFDGKILHVNSTVQRIKNSDGTGKTFLYESAPKSDYSNREIPLSDISISILKKINHKGRYVIAGEHPLEPRTYQNHLKKYLSEVNISYHNFHSIRHTFATNCIEAGMDVKCLSEILGHASVQITLNRYVHPAIDLKRHYMDMLEANYGHLNGQKQQ